MGHDVKRVFGQRKMVETKNAATCKFIEGERPYGPSPWCDAPTVRGKSYCPYHCRVAYRPFDDTAAKGFTEWAAGKNGTRKYG